MSYKLKTVYPSPKNQGRLVQTRGIASRITSCIVFLFFGFSGRASDTVLQSRPDPRLWDTAYMVRVFEDQFNGNSIDKSLWLVDECKGRGSIPSNNEGGSKNIEVSGGTLKMIARYEPGNRDTACWAGGFTSDYTTAEIYSLRHRFLYGLFETRCRLPEGKGLFYAWWLWGKGDELGFPQDRWASEIDVVEKIGRTPIHAIHYWPSSGPEIPLPDAQKRINPEPGEWHHFRVIWTPYTLQIFVDGKKSWEKSAFYSGRDGARNNLSPQKIRTGKIYRTRPWFPRHACANIFQMQLNNAIAGEEPASLPAVLEVDFVRVKQFFLAPEISCPDTISSSGVAILDADPRASAFSWRITPRNSLTGSAGGTGTTALIQSSGNYEGPAWIIWTFRMPSGETFVKEKGFFIRKFSR